MNEQRTICEATQRNPKSPHFSRGFGQRPDDSGVVGTLQVCGTETKQAVMLPDGRCRYLTPRECERLQGFPDDYTLITHRGKPAADGPRYKALGNSWAVPCVRWIFERMDVVDKVMRRMEVA